MPQELFIGREDELKSLSKLLHKKTASLVVISGRRRVGKSQLSAKFAEPHRFIKFTGLAPSPGIGPQQQRDEFALRLHEQTDIPVCKTSEWSELFLLLAEKSEHNRTIILLDEISWMARGDDTFLSKLKNAWDDHFKKNPQLILILCGSVSSWIEKNIISSTGFFGRISLKIFLEPLPLPDCNKMFDLLNFKRSPQEKFMILSVTGGIPWYLEQIDPLLSAEENIIHWCFKKNGLLVDEFKYIFHDLFGRRSAILDRIVTALTKGPAEFEQIAETLDYANSGTLSDYLNELIVAGFVRRDFTWNIKTGQDSKLSQYRLSDNYLRFYIRYIAPKYNQIQKAQFQQASAHAFSAWESVFGLQFENLVLQNRYLVQRELGIRPDDVVNDNPFFQHKTTKQQGCQIDYMIQTRYKTLFICEIKFSRRVLGSSIIHEMKEKLARLATARGYSYVPVLIHVNGVTEEVEENDFFFKIIDFSNLLIG